MNYCEACGTAAYGMPHHIKSKGAGGTTDAENMLQLCAPCHIAIHTLGDRRFTELWPHMYTRIAMIKWRIR